MRNKIGVMALLAAVLCGPLSADSASAQGRGRGQGQGRGQAEATTPPPVVVQFQFNDHDRDLVMRHYNAGLPPGLAKRGGDLPPGLAKQLRRNGTLPPGLQKKLRPFPRTLLDRLRPLPDGYRYGTVDEHVVIYRLDNFLIADIILHIVR